MDGDAATGITWEAGLLLLPGLAGWLWMLWHAKETRESVRRGAVWLHWRPLPAGLLPVVILAIGLGLIAQVALMSIVQALAGASMPAVGMHVIAIMTFHVPATVMAMAWFQRNRIPLGQGLGLEPAGWRDAAAGFGCYFLAFPMVVLASGVTMLLFEGLGLEMSLQPTVLDLKQIQSATEWGVVFVLVVIVGPFCEEVMFRGVLFPWLSHRLGIWGGLGLHSVVFALMHGHGASMFPLFVLSVLLGAVYMVRENLMAAVWMHSVFNAVSLLNVMLLAGGMEG